MNISEVEHIVNLSKKSIRYYEENGLLNPKRNHTNDYRIYDEKDVHKLKVIKFLRELDVSIRELKFLQDGSLTLSKCMEDRIFKVSQEQEKYEKVKKMCQDILESKEQYESFNIAKYFTQMNQLNKEGFTMRNLKTNKTKKIIGAVLSSILFCLFFLFLICVISYFQFTESTKIPWLVYGILMILFGIPIYGIVYNLIVRIQEINGGEEDEASKY